jgi:ankyrin repeat protein
MLGTRATGAAVCFVAACATSPDADLFHAVGAHDHEWTLQLVESGADLEARNAQNATPLMVAVFSSNLEGARILLEHGADPNARRSAPEPSGSAIFFADSEMIDLLVRHGADLELRSSEGQTPLGSNAARANVGPVQRLVAAGADVNARDDRGMTPLEAALLNRDQRPPEQIAAVVELLRGAGAR